jgi:hypothetical protein
MNRPVLCAAALVSLCSVVHAERIKILGVAATHFTRTNTVDIEILLNHPFTPGVDFLMFTGGDVRWSYGLADGRSFRIQNGTIAVPDDEFTVALRRHPVQGLTELVSRDPAPQVVVRDTMEDGVMRHAVAMSFPTDALGFAEMDMRTGYFNYIATVEIDGASDGVSGISETNNVHHTPEPSSVALLCIGGGVLALHLIRRPSLRIGRTKRQRVREPSGIGVR